MTQLEFNFSYPPGREIDLDGYIDEHGVAYIGKALEQPNGKWICLANVSGALCRVEVRIRPVSFTLVDKVVGVA